MEGVMSRWLMVLAIAVASSTASAESREAAQPVAVTAMTEGAVKSAEQQASQLAVKRETLARRYQNQLDQIDRLKNQRASWRRDRELRDSLSESLETANQLSTATRELGQARIALES